MRLQQLYKTNKFTILEKDDDFVFDLILPLEHNITKISETEETNEWLAIRMAEQFDGSDFAWVQLSNDDTFIIEISTVKRGLTLSWGYGLPEDKLNAVIEYFNDSHSIESEEQLISDTANIIGEKFQYHDNINNMKNNKIQEATGSRSSGSYETPLFKKTFVDQIIQLTNTSILGVEQPADEPMEDEEIQIQVVSDDEPDYYISESELTEMIERIIGKP